MPLIWDRIIFLVRFVRIDFGIWSKLRFAPICTLRLHGEKFSFTANWKWSLDWSQCKPSTFCSVFSMPLNIAFPSDIDVELSLAVLCCSKIVSGFCAGSDIVQCFIAKPPEFSMWLACLGNLFASSLSITLFTISWT